MHVRDRYWLKILWHRKGFLGFLLKYLVGSWSYLPSCNRVRNSFFHIYVNFSNLTLQLDRSQTHVNETFISKPGKTNYTDSKSFRPISLMSFVLKTLEKIIDRHIRNTTLVWKPLHKKQYAYQQEKSTEAALYHAVANMEQTIFNKESGIEVIKRSANCFGID
jgi:hypothetical protein